MLVVLLKTDKGLGGLCGGFARGDRPDFIGFNGPVVHQSDGDGALGAVHLGNGALLNTQSLGEIALGAVRRQVLPKGDGLHGMPLLMDSTNISTAVLQKTRRSLALLFAKKSALLLNHAHE
jgi:hypothetical protein